MQAISVWFPPGVTYPDDDESDLFDPAEFQSPETPKRIEGMLRSIGATIAKLGSGPQWYLHILATHPEHQGQGHASSLMKSAFIRADEERLPCTLVCPKHNIPVYEHIGFKVVAETRFADSEMFIYNMRREPSS
jgi:GNAT superfamily N-acetyltransferase